MATDRRHRSHRAAPAGSGRPRRTTGVVALELGRDPGALVERTGRPVAADGPMADLVDGIAGDTVDSHLDLLALARSIQAAAVADDLDGLARTVRRLQAGLHRHVACERQGQDHLPAPLRAVVFGGQDRLLRLVDAIGVEADGDAKCACVRHGAELVVALRRQAALEAAALRRPVELDLIG